MSRMIVVDLRDGTSIRTHPTLHPSGPHPSLANVNCPFFPNDDCMSRYDLFENLETRKLVLLVAVSKSLCSRCLFVWKKN